MGGGSWSFGGAASSLLSERSVPSGGAFSAWLSEEESDERRRDLAGADFRRGVELLGLDAGRGGLKGGAFRLDEGFALSIGMFMSKYRYINGNQ